MRHHRKPLHLALDNLPGHKTVAVNQGLRSSTNGKMTLYFLSGRAPELNPDELVWSHIKRTLDNNE